MSTGQALEMTSRGGCPRQCDGVLQIRRRLAHDAALQGEVQPGTYFFVGGGGSRCAAAGGRALSLRAHRHSGGK